MSQSLFENFELSGIWWLSGDPSGQVSGRLTFTHESRLLLELTGQFPTEPVLKDTRQPLFESDLIFGLSKNGEEYTLLNSRRVHTTVIKSQGFYVSSYESQVLLIGGFGEAMDDPSYIESRYQFPGLEESTAFKWFEIERQTNSFRWAKPAVTGAWIKRLDGRVSFDYDYSVTGLRGNVATARHSAFIKLEPRKAISIASILKTSSMLQNLLTLLYGQPTAASSITVKSKTGLQLAVFYCQGKAAVNPTLLLDEMVVPFLTLRSSSRASLFQAWFKGRPEVLAAADLFCGTLFQKGIYTRLEFVNHVQTLEAFHRAVYRNGGKYMDRVAYAPIAQKLIAAIPTTVANDHRAKLKSTINFGYEKAQRKRIEELFDSLPVDVRDFFSKNPNAFADKLVKTRNRYTHYDPTDNSIVFTDHEMAICNLGLRLLLIYLFLRYLRVPGPRIFHSFQRVQIGRIYNQMRTW